FFSSIMGDLCRTCTYKTSLWILVSLYHFHVWCIVQRSEASGTVYSRGNHWAVGHLMGKKSLDSLSGSEESNTRDGDYVYVQSAEEEKHLDEYVQPSKLVQAFLRALGGLENQTQRHRRSPFHPELPKMVQKDRERYHKQVSNLTSVP
uniref:Gastrin-releasing peptide n=1 Tax=Esox lucius TaxID=8010 RepID=A0AAY5K5S7_ESOLU